MSLPPQEELLSAFLDGEISPEEKAYVQQLLEENPELKERLRELSRIGESIRELPRETAPVDFAQSVLARVQDRPVPQTVANSKSITLTSRLRMWTSSVVAVAVVIGIGTFLIYQNPSSDQIANTSLSTNEAEESIEMAMAEAPSEVEGVSFLKSDSAGSEFAPGSLALEIETENGTDRSSSAALGSPTLEMASGGLLPESKKLPRVVSLDRTTIQQHLNSLGESPVGGDQISILTTESDAPILVDFTVVDVQKSLGKLRVLLKNHTIEEVQVDEQLSTAAFSADQKLVAVYLTLEEPDLEDVLSQVAALDATVIVEENRQFAAEDFAITQTDSNSEAVEMKVPTGGAALDGTQEGERYGDQPIASMNGQARKKVGYARARRLDGSQPQNFQFNLESLRFATAVDQAMLASPEASAAVQDFDDVAELAEIRIPPTPSLPEPLDEPTNENKTVRSRPMKSYELDKESKPTAPAVPIPAPASRPSKVEMQKKMKAVLILREENQRSYSE